MSSTNFKVIVVGGGPVGLVAAHALTQAGIDFIVLESRPSVVLDAGSNLVLLPMGMRVLGQLGLLEALDLVSSPLAQVDRFDHAGQSLGDSQFFVHFKENHGRYPRVISRQQLTKVLYDALPQARQQSMLVNKRVSDVSTTADGVTVSCRDGTSYEGSIVIGADGAHSLIRERMRSLALQAASSDISAAVKVNEEQPFLTTYRAMWVRFPTQAGIKPGDANETHGRNCAIQLFAGDDTTVIGIYERMETPTRERTRYAQADEEAFVERWGHLPISKNMTVRDAYASRVQAGMVNLEEGVVQHWGWDRIVLVGDAAHKFTPSTGAGCNNGIVDVVVLINQLNRVVSEAASPTGSKLVPAKEQISQAFEQYQNLRYKTVVAGCAGAGQATAAATWQDQTFKFVDRFVLSSHRMQKFFGDRNSASLARTPVFDFIEGEEQMNGKVPWAQAIKPRALVSC